MPYRDYLVENRILSPRHYEFRFFDRIYISSVLNFNMELQTQSNWCWAATAKSVSYFYSMLTPWTQCKIASEELSQTCCTSPVPGACNVPWYLNNALSRTNNFVSIQSGTITWEAVKAELDEGRVVGARIGWSGGGGHFMVIYGVSRILNTHYLHIDDPIYGKNTMSYQQFATNYQGSGTWTHTYFTKKYRYFMWLKDIVLQAELLNPIPQIRPLLNIHFDPAKDFSRIEQPELVSPHYVFELGLNDISSKMAMPSKAKSVRVFEMDKDQPLAFYDLSTDSKNPEVQQMSSNEVFFEQFDRALGVLKEASSSRKSQGELRLVRVPALNLEAAWLSYTGKDNDLVSVVPRFEYQHLKSGMVYSGDEFLQLLQKEKAAQGTMDDTMGA